MSWRPFHFPINRALTSAKNAVSPPGHPEGNVAFITQRIRGIVRADYQEKNRRTTWDDSDFWKSEFCSHDADLWTEGVYLYTCTIETVRIRKEKEQFPEM